MGWGAILPYTGTMGTPVSKLATWQAVWEADQTGVAIEVLNGVVVEKASPTDEHGAGQFGVSVEVGGPFARKGGSGGPGGWWLRTEVDIELSAHTIVRTDISGWRRERVPELPKTLPCRIPPDWVCEVLSPSFDAVDLFAGRFFGEDPPEE